MDNRLVKKNKVIRKQASEQHVFMYLLSSLAESYDVFENRQICTISYNARKAIYMQIEHTVLWHIAVTSLKSRIKVRINSIEDRARYLLLLNSITSHFFAELVETTASFIC